MPSYCVASVIEIRRFLTGELGDLDGKSELAAHLRVMRAACRKFLDASPSADHSGSISHLHDTAGWVFLTALGELRGVVGLQVAQIAGARRCEGR